MSGSLNVASPDCAEEFFGADRVVRLWHAASLPELYAVLHGRLADTPPAGGTFPADDGGPAGVTLDLIGHSTRGHPLLRLGRTPVDMLDPYVSRFFRKVVADGLMGRLGVTGVRLLGCETAVTESGRRTVRLLSRTLGVPVYGTLKPLLKSHSSAGGFNPAFGHLLSDGRD